MKSREYTTTLEFSFVGTLGLTFLCRARFSYLPADPGQTSGPPERCYPPEPAEVQTVYEAEVLEIQEQGVKIRLSTADLDDAFMDALHGALNESDESTNPDDGSDRAYEEARDRELERKWENDNATD